MTEPENKDKTSAQADNNSIAVGSIAIGGDVSGSVHVGDVGYTAEEVSALLTEITSTFQPKPFDGRCPYKGLDVFEEEDSELFFGREKLVADLVNRVKDSRTVFITGPSGSGKSSLVRAGLIHALKQGAINASHSERWLYATIKPGRDPIGELGRVASSLAGSTNAEDEIRAKALGDAAIFARWCEIALKEGRDKRVVLFIDQFEEVFTQIGNETERVAFLNLLTHAATVETGRVIILFSMRSDFVSNCATYSQLNNLLNQSKLYQIGAMQPDELVSAIAQPALRVGLRIDPDLIAQIINEMKGEPGALPLMQFALKDLFDSQQEKSGVIALTLNDYLQRGGIHKALERHADDSFSKLSKNEQELARSIFSGLIEIGRGTQDTKRTALFDELIPANAKAEEIEAIVQKLADARLLTTDEQAGKDTVTISHEKLIDAWPWLRKLVNENRDVIALQNQISADAKEWEEHKRDASYLYAGGRLANVHEQFGTNKPILSGAANEFIQSGYKKQRQGQMVKIFSITAVLALIVVGALVFSYQSTANAKKLVVQSDLFANTQQAIASTSQANANTAATAQVKAEEQAQIAFARQLAAQAQSIYTNGDPTKQETAFLLAVRSMQSFPVIDAAQILQTNKLVHVIAHAVYDNDVTLGSGVTSIAFSPDRKYVVFGWCKFEFEIGCIQGSAARVLEIASGKEIARMSHNDSQVNSVAFSSNGKYVVSGGADGTARVWESASGLEVIRITHDGPVSSVAFSPDDRYIASGGCESESSYSACTQSSIRIWEFISGNEVVLISCDSWVSSIAFSPDGKYVIVESNDGNTRVWEATTGNEVARVTYGNSVAFSLDGKYAASGGCYQINNYVCTEGIAHVWEIATGVEIARMTHDGDVTSIAFSPDGRYMVSGSFDDTARVWEIVTGKEVARMTHTSRVDSVAFSPNGKYVVSGSYDNSARVWESTTGVEVARMTHNDGLISVAFSPDGKYIVSASRSDIYMWEYDTGLEVVSIPHDDNVLSVAFSPDGKYVMSSGSDIRLWEVTTGIEVARMPLDNSAVNSYVIFAAFSPDGKYVVSGGHNTVRVWKSATGVEIARMTHAGVDSVAFSPDGKYVVSGGQDDIVRVWEAATGTEVTRMVHDDEVLSVAFSPDGKYVISGGWDNTARVWESTTGIEVIRMTHDDVVDSIIFSPDGKYVVSTVSCQVRHKDPCVATVRVWEAATGVESAHMIHDGAITSVALSPDGKYVVSGSEDGATRVWEASTGTEIARMTYDGGVSSVAFSPNGKYVVSGSYDGNVRVWEASTGAEIARMPNYARGSVAFSPNGKYVVSGGWDEPIRVWIYRPSDLIANACYRISRNLTRLEWKTYIGNALPYQAVCENLPLEPEATTMPTVTP